MVSESGGYMWEKMVYPYPEAQQPFYQKMGFPHSQ